MKDQLSAGNRPSFASGLPLMIGAVLLAGCTSQDWCSWLERSELEVRSREYQERGFSEREAEREARHDFIEEHHRFPGP